jgi:Ca2+-binding EF-hand superfamily protein
MSDLLKTILADHQVDEAELKALFNEYDTSGDGVLDVNEQLVLARDVAVMTGASTENVLSILNFYQQDWNNRIDQDELRAFLEVYVAE